MRLPRDFQRRVRRIVGPEGFLDGPAAVRVYECDGYTLEKARPELVVLPETTGDVAKIIKLCNSASVPFVPRGAGTGVSGGCLPERIPVMIGTSRMRRVRSIDPTNRRIEVEAGVVNLEVTRQAAKYGLYYAPDPSSQSACTIGGNLAENSGGPHTLKYGVTTNHTLALEVVLPNGDVTTFDRGASASGYDLAGVSIGAEGTLGVITSATLGLLPTPPAVTTLLAVFPDVATASRAVSAIIAAGIVPAALEMMDSLVIQAVEAAYSYGFPEDAGAVLLVELDGLPAGVEAQADQVSAACRTHDATEVRRAESEDDRAALWKSRKQAFGAMGRLAPAYCTQDGVVPRSRLPDIVSRIATIASKHELRIANLMHAGDGNIHPLILYDDRNNREVKRVIAAGHEILTACVHLGGSLTGEHGIGVEKIGLMSTAFSEDDLAAMGDLRDAFNPKGLCNPAKILPTPGGCVEVTRPRPRGGG